jgi:hypothetical protein
MTTEPGNERMVARLDRNASGKNPDNELELDPRRFR